MKTFVAISGSLRSQSFSTTILSSLAEEARDICDIRVVLLNDIPLYNEDDDTDSPPESVANLRAAIQNSNGLIIASPEYNYGISGVLKNALDWASRPYARSSLQGKTALTVTSSLGPIGGARAHVQLQQTLASNGVRTILRPQATIGNVRTKIDNGRLFDRPTMDFLMEGVRELAMNDFVSRHANYCAI